jgi:hypothetical protein
MNIKQGSVTSETSERSIAPAVTLTDQAPLRYGWPKVTDEQRSQDIQIRLLQAEARRQADNAIRDLGRLWVSTERLPQREGLLVPPQFEEAIGYTGAARYVGLYWGAGEECYLNDGLTVHTGEADAFLAYTRHWSIAPALCGADLGSSAGDATHWLLLDRIRRHMTLAYIEDAKRMIRDQWSIPEQESVLVVECGEWAVLVQELEERMSQIHPDLTWEIEHQAQVVEMISWLERERGQQYGN